MKRTWAFTMVIAVLAGLSAWGWHSALAPLPGQAAPPAQEDLAVITSPQNNAIVRGQLPILGSAMHPQFQFYKVEVSLEPVGGDQSWAIIGAIRNEPVADGQLEVWDTTQVADGSYSLRVRVVRADGNYSEYSVVQIVVANTQPEQPTETPVPEEEPTPTRIPTPLPPTPTIVIEQPALPTSPAIPGVTRTPLPTPSEDEGGFDFNVVPLQTACLYGAGAMLGLFILFGFMAVLRNLIYSVIGRRDQ